MDKPEQLGIIFQAESILNSLEEAKPLLELHYKEIAHYKDIPLDPDYDMYFKLEAAGITKSFAARTKEGALIGYAVFIVRPHIHYRSMLLAASDIIFLHPEHRGIGYFFIKYCDQQLKEMGCTVVSHHIKVKFDFSRMLERMGYEFMDKILVRRLN